jgi:hypothetical protein
VHCTRVQPRRDERLEDLRIAQARGQRARTLGFTLWSAVRCRALASSDEPTDGSEVLQNATPLAIFPGHVLIGSSANDLANADATAADLVSKATDLPHGDVGRYERPENGVFPELDALGDFDLTFACEEA